MSTTVMLDATRGIVTTPRYRFLDVAMPDGDWLKFAKFTTDDGRTLIERPLTMHELNLAQALRRHVPRDQRLAAAQAAASAIEEAREWAHESTT